MVRNKRKARRCASKSAEGDRDGCVVDVSCLRLVKYEECDENTRTYFFLLRTCHLDPNAKPEPIAATTRSKMNT